MGARTTITHSSIGKNCTIGNGVTIVGCYIWDNVVIGDNCTLTKSLLADDVVLKEGVTVEPGCIVSFRVVIGANFVIKSGSRLTTSANSSLPCEDGWGDKASVAVSQTKPVDMAEEVGEGGRGFRWEPPAVDSDDDSETIVVEKWNQNQREEEEETEADESSSLESSPSATPEPLTRLASEGDTDNAVFYQEVLDSIRSGVADSVPNENTILMINSSKHAYNVPIHDVPPAVVKAILEGPTDSSASDNSLFLTHVQKAFTHFQPLLAHYIKDSYTQLSVIKCLTDCACKSSHVMATFPKILLLLYNIDIIEEVPILAWHDELTRGELTRQCKEVLDRVQPVIEWLKNAEEESD